MSHSSVGPHVSIQPQITPTTPKKSTIIPHYLHKDSQTSFQLPSSLTPVSEEFYTESDLILEADSASVAEADTEAATEAIRFVTTPASTELLSRKRSAQSLEEPYAAGESRSGTSLVARSEPCDSNFSSLPMLPPARLSSEISNNSEQLSTQIEGPGTYNTSTTRGSQDSLRPPNKRARPSLSDPVSVVNRSVYIDPYQQQTEGAISQQRASSAGVNIAPRAHRRGKRRAVSKSPWTLALKQLLPVLKTESLISLLLTACERHHPTAEAVRSYVIQESASRRLLVRNVPYSMNANELKDALESAFGAVEKVAVSAKGFAVVVFESFGAAFHAAFGHPPPDAPNGSASLGPHEALTSLSVKGRQLQFRYLPTSDGVWDILLGGPGIEVVTTSMDMRDVAPPGATKNDGNSSSAAQVGPRRNRAQGTGSRRRRATELLIRDLSPSTTEVALASAFAHFGDIRRVYVPTDARGQPRGHGYVKFHKQEDALRAAQQTQRLIGDQLAFVSLAGADRSRRSQPSQPTNVVPAGMPVAGPQRRRGRNRTLQTRGKTSVEGDNGNVTVNLNIGGEDETTMAEEREMSSITASTSTAMINNPSCEDNAAE